MPQLPVELFTFIAQHATYSLGSLRSLNRLSASVISVQNLAHIFAHETRLILDGNTAHEEEEREAIVIRRLNRVPPALRLYDWTTLVYTDVFNVRRNICAVEGVLAALEQAIRPKGSRPGDNILQALVQDTIRWGSENIRPETRWPEWAVEEVCWEAVQRGETLEPEKTTGGDQLTHLIYSSDRRGNATMGVWKAILPSISEGRLVALLAEMWTDAKCRKLLRKIAPLLGERRPASFARAILLSLRSRILPPSYMTDWRPEKVEDWKRVEKSFALEQ